MSAERSTAGPDATCLYPWFHEDGCSCGATNGLDALDRDIDGLVLRLEMPSRKGERPRNLQLAPEETHNLRATLRAAQAAIRMLRAGGGE